MTDKYAETEQRLRRKVIVAASWEEKLGGLDAALDRLLAYREARAKVEMKCPHISCGGCKQHSDDYERSEQAARTAYRAYACTFCRELDRLTEAAQ